MRVSSRAPDRPFSPARSSGVRVLTWANEPPGALAPSPLAGSACQAKVRSPHLDPPVSVPGGNAVPVRFASQPGQVRYAVLQSRLACSAASCAAAGKATPANCPDILKYSDVFEDLPRSGRGHYAGGFSPKGKVRFLFALFRDQHLGSALNLFSWRSEKSVGLAPEFSRFLETDEELASVQRKPTRTVSSVRPYVRRRRFRRRFR